MLAAAAAMEESHYNREVTGREPYRGAWKVVTSRLTLPEPLWGDLQQDG